MLSCSVPATLFNVQHLLRCHWITWNNIVKYLEFFIVASMAWWLSYIEPKQQFPWCHYFWIVLLKWVKLNVGDFVFGVELRSALERIITLSTQEMSVELNNGLLQIDSTIAMYKITDVYNLDHSNFRHNSNTIKSQFILCHKSKLIT